MCIESYAYYLFIYSSIQKDVLITRALVAKKIQSLEEIVGLFTTTVQT